jgi:uncharacterized protein (TIGR02270 family)
MTMGRNYGLAQRLRRIIRACRLDLDCKTFIPPNSVAPFRCCAARPASRPGSIMCKSALTRNSCRPERDRTLACSTPVYSHLMAAALFISEVVDRHCEDAASLWLMRANAVRASNFRLADLAKLDKRIEANIDGLRIAQMGGWSIALDEFDRSHAGDFFIAGILAVESDNPDRFDQVIERAHAGAAKTAEEPYDRAYDPWRGLVSALAWVDSARTSGAINRLLDTARPRTRWLGVAACGARRIVRHAGLEAALADPEPLVRARASRAMGELGRVDLRAELNALLIDPDEDCRFWAAWSAARLGRVEGLRALAEFARSPGPWGDRALDLLLRRLSTERANTFLRTLARDSERSRTLIRATGVVGDPLYLPWLVGHLGNSTMARLAGDAFATITGVDLVQLELERRPSADFGLGPTDDAADDNVMLDEDEGLPWPDPEKLRHWWDANKARYITGTSYFLGTPKTAVDWLSVLSYSPQHIRRAAALELALKRPTQAMFEVRARGALQLTQLARTAGQRVTAAPP